MADSVPIARKDLPPGGLMDARNSIASLAGWTVHARLAEADQVHQARQARLKFLKEGELPSGVLREEIDTSWRRSLGHGLNCLEGEMLDSQQDHDLQQLLAKNRLLINAAAPEMEYLVSQHGKNGLVILGDAQANVLVVEGQTELLNTGRLPLPAAGPY